MKNIIKLFGFMILGIIFLSCDNADSSIDETKLKFKKIQAYINSDSTIISDDYPVFKEGSYEYVFNSKRELIGEYYVDYNTDNLIILIFFCIIGFFGGYLIRNCQY